MTIPGHERVSRRELDVHGRDVTIVQYSFGAENAYGDRPKNQASTSTVTARVQRSTDASKRSDPDGEVTEADVTIYVKDSVTVDDGPPQTEFEVDGETYIAVRADDEDNGLLTVDCRREE
jgi:hypothetical protein